jgi:hypothetical protein
MSTSAHFIKSLVVPYTERSSKANVYYNTALFKAIHHHLSLVVVKEGVEVFIIKQ